MAASPDGIQLFSLIMELARHKPHSKPEDITPFEQYVLADALSFFKAGAVFPKPVVPMTYLEYLFLLEGYKVYYEEKTGTVYSPEFERGIKELSKAG